MTTTIADLVADQVTSHLEDLARRINDAAGEGHLTIDYHSPDRWAAEHGNRRGVDGIRPGAGPDYLIPVCVPILADRLATHLGTAVDTALHSRTVPRNGSVVDVYLEALTALLAAQLAYGLTYDAAVEWVRGFSAVNAAILIAIDTDTMEATST